MGCSYFTAWTVKIRPDEIGALRAAIGAKGMDGFFTLNGDILSCEACSDNMGFITMREVAVAIEDFAKGPVSDAAAESVCVTATQRRKSCDGDDSQYGIGPDAAGALSAHRLSEIRDLAADLTDDDAAALARELNSRTGEPFGMCDGCDAELSS